MEDKQYLAALNEIAKLVGRGSAREYLELDSNGVITALKKKYKDSPTELAKINDLSTDENLIFVAKEIHEYNKNLIKEFYGEATLVGVPEEKSFFLTTLMGAITGMYYCTDTDTTLPEKVTDAIKVVVSAATPSMQFVQKYLRQHNNDHHDHVHDEPHSPFHEGLEINEQGDSSKLIHLLDEQREIFAEANPRQGISSQYGNVVMPVIGLKTSGSGTGISMKAIQEYLDAKKEDPNAHHHIEEVGIHNDNLAADNRIHSQVLVNKDGTYNAQSIFSQTFINLKNLSATRVYGTASRNEQKTEQTSLNFDHVKTLLPESLEGKQGIWTRHFSGGFDVANFPQYGGYQGNAYGRGGFAWNTLNSTTSLTLVGNQQISGNQFQGSNLGYDFTYTRAIDGYNPENDLKETEKQTPQFREAYFSFGRNPIEQTNYVRAGYNEDRSDKNPDQFIRAIHGVVGVEKGKDGTEIEAEVHFTAKIAPNLSLNGEGKYEAEISNAPQPVIVMHNYKVSGSLASMIINEPKFKLLAELGAGISSGNNLENPIYSTTQATVKSGAHAVIGDNNPVTLSVMLNLNTDGNLLNPNLIPTETPLEIRASMPLNLGKKKENPALKF